MYEKMFNALEQGNTQDSHGNYNNNSSRKKKTEEIFNSTSMSFGKEIEHMQK